MTTLLTQLLDWLTPRATFRRYRVTSRRNPSAVRRDLLGRILHNLNRDSDRTVHD